MSRIEWASMLLSRLIGPKGLTWDPDDSQALPTDVMHLAEPDPRAPSMSKPKTLPESASDSTITSLSDLVAAIPADKLAEHVEEQVEILEGANIDLDEAAAYYSGLLHDREAFRKLNAHYDEPTSEDTMRLRLMALYYIGLKHFSPTSSRD